MEGGRPDILQAILLLGPTGSGKTPLGQYLQTHGLAGRLCHHFDFGANLRTVVANGPSGFFSGVEIEFLKGVLSRGALLENESFHLAARILAGFVERHRVEPGHWLILNGLPRHIGQARALESCLRVSVLIELECDAATVRERVQRDTGGDRGQRLDDDGHIVARKLALYEERTRPLAAHYRSQGVRLISIPVRPGTRPSSIVRQLEQLRV